MGLERQNHFRLADARREDRPDRIGARPGIAKHILVEGHKAAGLVHDAQPFIEAVIAGEIIH